MAEPHERVLAILFTDVEGSTELRNRYGDAAANEVLAIHETIVRARIEHHGGEQVQFLGDGFLAAFAAAADAVACAVDVQRALEEHNQRDPAREVHVRIGVHSGPVSEREGNLLGQAVHAAARVTAEAAGGRILVSSSVRDLLPPGMQEALADRGLFWLKGFPQRWRLFEVAWQEVSTEQATSGELPATTPFVERDEERADLRRWVDRARGGKGSVVLVAGEAGVGKSRLLTEVQADAAALGMRVLVGHCSETGTGTPYLPFVDFLEQALIAPRSPLALREALGDASAEIARLVPGVRRVVPNVPLPLELPPEQARRYLWNSILEFLERASRDRPLLLGLEDLHWADESTILLVEHLAPRLTAMPILLVGTYRDNEIGVGHPLAAVVTTLVRRRVATMLPLGRLSYEGVRGMVDGLAGQHAPDGLVDAVHAETDGNPFFVEEVYLHLAESGLLLDAAGRFRADLRIDELDVPESIRLVVGGRLARLREVTREVLTAAAVVGRHFATDVAELVSGRAPGEVADALDEAERARLVAPDGDPTRLAFTHELIRQTLIADVSSQRRQRLHAAVVDAFEDVYGDELDEHAADLAYHLSRSGAGADAARLARYLQLAGDRAAEASAYEDAVSSFERALALVPAHDRETRAGLLERLAMARRSVGDWDGALGAMDEALALYTELGLPEAIGRLCWAMVYHLAWTVQFEKAVEVAGRGLAALGAVPNPDRARLLSATGWVVGLAGDHDAATPLFAQARDLAEELGDKRALADALHMQTIHHMQYAQFADGIETGTEAAATFEAVGAVWDLCSVLAFVLYQAGAIMQYERAASLRALVLPLAARLGHLGATFLALADQIRVEGIARGDLARVEVIAREQIDVCERGGLPWLYVGHLYLGFAAHWRGEWGDAERHLRDAARLEAPGAFSGQSVTHLAVHLALDGRPEEVMAIFEEHRAALPVPGQVYSLGSLNMMMALTEALYVAGRRDEVAPLYPLIRDVLASGPSWIAFDGRLMETRAGLAAAAAGRWEESDEHFEEATAIAAAQPNVIEEADVGRYRAMTLLDRAGSGDAARAADLLTGALQAYERLGMPRHTAVTRALLARAEGAS